MPGSCFKSDNSKKLEYVKDRFRYAILHSKNGNEVVPMTIHKEEVESKIMPDWVSACSTP
jgi:hypothetical protein